jgi:hypothetical protein
MSFLEPDPPPLRYRLFAYGVLALCVPVLLDGFHLVELHGWGGTAQMVYVAALMVYDARMRRREARRGE